MEKKKEKPAQLVWDRGVPIWRATRAAIKAGFPTKRANLSFFAHDEAALLRAATVSPRNRMIGFPGAGASIRFSTALFATVINLWQTDPTSPYHALEASSRHPYDVYARMILQTVGERRVDAIDGRDLRRWHAEWSAPLEENRKPR